MKAIIQFAFLFIGIIFISVTNSQSQTIHITNGTASTCQSIFRDDGAGVNGTYEAGKSYVFTLCPDIPGGFTSVSFDSFSLFKSYNSQNSDYLIIYDGNTITAPLLGSYTGTELQGLPITASLNNTSGCLTFAFYAKPYGNINGDYSGWEAQTSCTDGCSYPTAAAVILDPAPESDVEQTITVCDGQVVTFQDIGSYAEPGTQLQYWVWNFGDGTKDTLTSPANVTHSYSEPGEYLVTLTVFNNNGCRSLNASPMKVLVSTIPIFNTEFESPVCVGNEVTINGAPVQSITWTALPPQTIAGTMYLPDGAGFSFESSLVYDFFEEGATLDNCYDFHNLFMNIEHSYLGDLSMSITCPNGTQVTLLQNPNTGGGTFLGEAVDVNNSNAPGIGWDYGFSPSATNGFITDIDNRTHNPFTDVLGNVWNVNIVNPGIYESFEDLCQLVGCPLNGEWTFIITDHYIIDNGYLFEWGINFNPNLYPYITQFTPVIGMGSDSTWWEGPNITSSSANGNTITTTHLNTGSYDYTFFATNNFGCTYDTTITIEVLEGPEITAGPDLFYCNEPVTLQAGFVQQPECGADVGNYTYCVGNNANLIQTFCPENPGDGISFMEITINSGRLENHADKLFIYDGDDITAPMFGSTAYTGSNLAGIFHTATMANPTGCITIQITSDGSLSCETNSISFPPIDVTIGCSTGSNMVWEWSPTTGLSDPNIQNPTAEVIQTTTYTLNAYPVGFPGCVLTDQVVVWNDESNQGINTDTVICDQAQMIFLTDYLQGSSTSEGIWTDEDGNEIPNTLDISTFDCGTSHSYTYMVVDNPCYTGSTLSFTLICEPNAGEDGMLNLCHNSGSFSLFDGLTGTYDPGGIWTNNAGDTITNPSLMNASDIATGGDLYTYTIHTSPCTESSATVTVNIYPEIIVNNVITTCSPSDSSYTVTFNISGGTPPYFVDGDPMDNNIFTSLEISDYLDFNFDVTDSESCGGVIVSGDAPDCNTTGVFGSSDEGLFFKIYPNPVREELHLDLPENISGSIHYRIINLTGQLMLQEITTLPYLKVDQLPSGIYILEISHNIGTYRGRFAKIE